MTTQGTYIYITVVCILNFANKFVCLAFEMTGVTIIADVIPPLGCGLVVQLQREILFVMSESNAVSHSAKSMCKVGGTESR